MRIKQLYIGNYRSIHQETFRFDKINVFVGANNSGKSNIVRALKLFFDIRYEITSDEIYTGTRSQTIVLRIVISIEERKERASLQAFKIAQLSRNDFLKIERRQHLGEKPKYYDISKPPKKRKIKDQELYNMGRFFRKHFLFMDVLSSEELDFEHLEKSISYIQERKTSEYVKRKFKSEIQPAFRNFNKYIKRFFESSLDKFSRSFELTKQDLSIGIFPEPEKMFSNIRMQLNQGDLNPFLINKGQGIKNISAFILSGVFDNKRSHLVVLEEPEIHLHPSLLRKLIDSIKNMPGYKQFFITTHSCDIIDGFEPKYLKRVVMRNGKTHVIAPKLKDNLIYNFYKHIYGNYSECFLSKRVLIAEGESEVRLLPGLSDKVFLGLSGSKKPASLDVNEIQIVQVGGGNFHGPVGILDAFEIDWLILGDADKWPIGFLNTIKALKLYKAHPRKYRILERKASEQSKLTEEIRNILYEYFRIICLPERLEDLLVSDENARQILNILKIYLSGRYKYIIKQKKFQTDIEICKEIMKKDKPQWSIILAKKLDASLIPQGIKKLLELIVNRPKSGTIDISVEKKGIKVPLRAVEETIALENKPKEPLNYIQDRPTN